MNGKPMTAKKRGKTRRTKDPIKRVNQEFRAFKKNLHRMVDKCSIDWEGKPYSGGSTYRFTIPPDLVNLIVGLVVQTQQQQEKERAESLTLENAKLLRAVAVPSEPEGEGFGVEVDVDEPAAPEPEGEPSEPEEAPSEPEGEPAPAE